MGNTPSHHLLVLAAQVVQVEGAVAINHKQGCLCAYVELGGKILGASAIQEDGAAVLSRQEKTCRESVFL